MTRCLPCPIPGPSRLRCAPCSEWGCMWVPYSARSGVAVNLSCAAQARWCVASSLSGVLPRSRFLAFLGGVPTQAVYALR